MSDTDEILNGRSARKVIVEKFHDGAPGFLGELLDAYRAEVRREVGTWLLTQQVREPDGEAEEHVNDVLQNLARELGAGR